MAEYEKPRYAKTAFILRDLCDNGLTKGLTDRMASVLHLAHHSTIMFTLCQSCGSANAAGLKECRKCGMPLIVDTKGAEASAKSTSSGIEDSLKQTIAEPRTPAPLSTKTIAEHDRSSQVTKIMQSTRMRAAKDAPLAVRIFFPHALFEWNPSQVYFELRNLSETPVESVELSIGSRGLGKEHTQSFHSITSNENRQFCLDIEPNGSGEFVLHYRIKAKMEGQWKQYFGERRLWINSKPAEDAYPVASSQVKVNREFETLENALNQASEPRSRGSEIPFSSWAELSEFRLPEWYEELDLVLDYQLSVSAAEEFGDSPAKGLLIPRLFISNAHPGTKLKLTPVNDENTLGIHLVAREQFKIGRSRFESDFICWFWPRSATNDERTKHISRVHVEAERRGTELFLRDISSSGGSSFDGQPLNQNCWEPITGRGTLLLAGDYSLDLQPLTSPSREELNIKNLKMWVGPEKPKCPLGGCVVFVPTRTQVVHYQSIWLFSSAAFGSSRLNPVAIGDPALAEIQGCFHHFQGAFWLENRVKNDLIQINSYELAPNEIAPLISGQMVQLGKTKYQVEVLF